MYNNIKQVLNLQRETDFRSDTIRGLEEINTIAMERYRFPVEVSSASILSRKSNINNNNNNKNTA